MLNLWCGFLFEWNLITDFERNCQSHTSNFFSIYQAWITIATCFESLGDFAISEDFFVQDLVYYK